MTTDTEKTTSIGAVTILALLLPAFQGHEFRTFRLSCFCAAGLSGFIPIIDGLYVYGWNYMARYSLKYYLLEMFLEMIGALFYGLRIPERLYPGKFDIFGSSHQIFHVCAVAAALVHLLGLTNAAVNTRGQQRCFVG